MASLHSGLLICLSSTTHRHSVSMSRFIVAPDYGEPGITIRALGDAPAVVETAGASSTRVEALRVLLARVDPFQDDLLRLELSICRRRVRPNRLGSGDHV